MIGYRNRALLLLQCSAAAATIGLGLRAYFGPMQFAAISIGSPLGCESVISISLLAILLLRAAVHSQQASTSSFAQSGYCVPLILLVIAGVFAGNLSAPFLSDDYIVVPGPSILDAPVGTWFRTAMGDGSFRPLTDIYFASVRPWAGSSPLKWHVLGLSIHLLNCTALYLLVVQLWRDRGLAIASALVFGIHGTRAEAVAWPAATFDLLATACVLASAVFYFSSVPKWIRWTFSLAFAAAGVLCKESAYAFPLLLLSFAYAAGRVDRDFLTFTAIAATLCAALFAYRWHLFHGPGGYVDPVTGRFQILSLQPLSVAKVLLARSWTILFFPINWSAPMGVVTKVAIPTGALALVFLVSKASPIPRTVLVGSLGSVLVCILPVIHLALLGDSALGSRYFYLPAVGFSMLAGFLVRQLTRRSLLCASLAYVAVTLTITFHNLAAWRNVAARADQVCAEAAACGSGFQPSPPPTLDGVYYFQNGFQACMDMKRASQ